MASTKQVDNTRRVTCRNCRTRYDTAGMQPGTPFSCRRCGEVIYVPGKRAAGQQDKTEIPFGQAAVEMGFITTAQLATALKIHRAAGKTRLRLGDVLVEKNFLNQKQVTAILHRQGSRVAFLIPGYEIVEKLGQGGMGAVYKGVHLASRKTVAMKILSEKLSRRPEFLERFHREARVAIKLDHPNIVKGFDEGSVGKTHYFVMEYVHGKSASRVLKKRRRFGERRSMDIIRQVSQALDYAHEHNILHRDIKPDNIMMTREGKIKLADYGLVKYMDDVNEAGLTSEGQIMGTPNYISPEQASGKRALDIRSDIYSLGATLFHLLTGSPPYTGKSAGAIMGMHISAAVPDPKKINPGLTPEACGIVRRMMAKNLSERYQTPAELLEDLEKYFSRKPTNAGALQPSGAALVTPPPWDTSAPEAESHSDPADEEEDLLESVGEDHRQLSYMAPILFGVGAGLLLLGIAATLYVFLARPQPGPKPQEPDDMGRISRPDESRNFKINNADRHAAEIYKAAIDLEGEERIRRFQELIKKYPRSKLAQVVRGDVAAFYQQKRAKLTRELKARKQQRELSSLRAYYQTLQQRYRTHGDFLAALRKIQTRFRGTKGARLAHKRENRLREEMRNRDSAGKDDGNRLEQEQRKREEEIARIEFIDAFTDALENFSLSRAMRLALKLSANKRFPQLSRLGRNCRDDIADLMKFYPAVQAGLQKMKADNKEVKLVFGRNNSVKGRVLSARDGKIKILIGDELVYEQKLLSLSDIQAERLFRASYHDAKPPPDLVLMLFYFARKNHARARNLLNQVYKQDPRRSHHTDMFNWE